jgi:hypothetical protein
MEVERRGRETGSPVTFLVGACRYGHGWYGVTASVSTFSVVVPWGIVCPHLVLGVMFAT